MRTTGDWPFVRRALWYDLDHNPISMEEGSRLLASVERHLFRDVIMVGNEPVWVSTVFLVLDHNFGPGPPLLYETMTFSHEEEISNLCWRYATREQAEAGHQAAVQELTTMASATTDDKE